MPIGSGSSIQYFHYSERNEGRCVASTEIIITSYILMVLVKSTMSEALIIKKKKKKISAISHAVLSSHIKTLLDVRLASSILPDFVMHCTKFARFRHFF